MLLTYCRALQCVGSQFLIFLQELDARRLVLTTLFGGALISESLPCFPMSVADPFQLIFLSPSAIGCAAPVGHYWYRSLDYLFLQKCRWPQASARFVLSKVRLHSKNLPHLNPPHLNL